MVILIVLIAGISAALLTAINIFTAPRIRYNEQVKLKKSVLDVFSIPYTKSNIMEIFDKKIKVESLGDKAVFKYYEGGRFLGIAFKMRGAGFWGPITGMVALTPSLDRLLGVEVLHQEETPGLGGRIVEDEFKAQFRGRSVEPEIEVDAITGATMTSKAFRRIINENVKAFREEFRKR